MNRFLIEKCFIMEIKALKYAIKVNTNMFTFTNQIQKYHEMDKNYSQYWYQNFLIQLFGSGKINKNNTGPMFKGK